MAFDITKIESAMFEIEDMITLPEAEKLVNFTVTRPTLRTWCEKYGIGRKVGGRWYVDPEKLTLLLEGALKNFRR
jgi:hypothetical protein